MPRARRSSSGSPSPHPSSSAGCAGARRRTGRRAQGRAPRRSAGARRAPRPDPCRRATAPPHPRRRLWQVEEPLDLRLGVAGRSLGIDRECHAEPRRPAASCRPARGRRRRGSSSGCRARLDGAARLDPLDGGRVQRLLPTQRHADLRQPVGERGQHAAEPTVARPTPTPTAAPRRGARGRSGATLAGTSRSSGSRWAPRVAITRDRRVAERGQQPLEHRALVHRRGAEARRPPAVDRRRPPGGANRHRARRPRASGPRSARCPVADRAGRGPPGT